MPEKPDNFLNEPERTPVVTPQPTEVNDDPFAPFDATPDPEPFGNKPASRWKPILGWSIAVVIVALGIAIWLRYFNPVATDAVTRGYIRQVERRGIVFKTFEVDMITEAALTDTTRLYSREMSLSVTNDSLAHFIREYQGTGRPVTITYKRYSAPVAWRGASKMIVTDFKPE